LMDDFGAPMLFNFREIYHGSKFIFV